MFNLKTKVSAIYGVGPKTFKLFQKLGIINIEDLLNYFPSRYDDFSKISKISESYAGEHFAFKGVIKQIKTIRSFRKRMFITNAILEDDSSAMKVVWFNQPYLTKTLRAGTKAILVGKVERDGFGLHLSSPLYEQVKREQIHSARIVPVYAETKGLNSKFLRSKIKIVIKLAKNLEEFLPQNIIKKYHLISFVKAIEEIHFPKDNESLSAAQKRLAFNELLFLQLKMLAAKKEWSSQEGEKLKFSKEKMVQFVKQLPFKLTPGQKQAAWEIICDITAQKQKTKKNGQKIPPMNRLLEGDVGSGKTIVAAMAMYLVALNNYQSILMAPTEILAFQHYGNLLKLFKPFNFKIGLLTNSKSLSNGRKLKKNILIKKVKEGKINIVVGTHALIAEKMEFKKLALAVIDEQHRFGVEQRAALRKKSHLVPHILSMTATPIPRTLSLVLYGDLEVSIIKHLPPGRQQIETHIIHPQNRQKAYWFIEKEVQNGRQAFVICPLIEESDKLGVKSVKEEYERLSKEIFPHLKIAFLHGKMKSQEKEKTMKNFAAGKFDILVSTSVVEVGVDIPNATVMMIEGAQRFGLAQLHQFRGRVGRGKFKSYCFLFTDIPSKKVISRLHALVESSDGFALAEKDLQFRGPGEIYGVKQSGIIDLKMAKLSDIDLLYSAREAAQTLLKNEKDFPKKLQKKMNNLKIEKRLE